MEGVWYELVMNVNRMCTTLTDQVWTLPPRMAVYSPIFQVRSIANVTTAVACGDLTQKIEIQVEGALPSLVSYLIWRSLGEMATLKATVNSMVSQLQSFASEVTRVALEVGTQGILGGQARVEGVQGTWADLTRNVNVRSLFISNPLLTCAYK